MLKNRRHSPRSWQTLSEDKKKSKISFLGKKLFHFQTILVLRLQELDLGKKIRFGASSYLSFAVLRLIKRTTSKSHKTSYPVLELSGDIPNVSKSMCQQSLSNTVYLLPI